MAQVPVGVLQDACSKMEQMAGSLDKSCAKLQEVYVLFCFFDRQEAYVCMEHGLNSTISDVMLCIEPGVLMLFLLLSRMTCVQSSVLMLFLIFVSRLRSRWLRS
jgi:hypothetical protein